MSFVIYASNADLYRLRPEISNSSREKYQLVRAGLKVNLQPAGLEYVVTDPQGGIGKNFKAFTTYSGCQIGMVLVTSGTLTTSGSRYDVVGVEPWSGPLGKHFELLVRKSTN